MALQGEVAARATFASLPRNLALAVFALAPLDTRLRCAEVSPAWRDMLKERSLWTLLDLTLGIAEEEDVPDWMVDALLRAASKRAGGHVQTLDVTAAFDVSMVTLLEVVAENAAALRTLRIGGAFMGSDNEEDQGRDTLAALLAAAPLLQVVYADANCASSADALEMLRGTPPFGPLRIERLDVEMHDDDAARVHELAAAVAAHKSLHHVGWFCARLDAPGTLDATVDAVLTCAVRQVMFYDCRLTPASAPGLARLLSGSALTKLVLIGGPNSHILLDAPASALLGAALSKNSTLKSLTLSRLHLWRDIDRPPANQ